jgi:hypothetical protein
VEFAFSFDHFSPAGGALLIPAFFEKFGLRELINKNIALCSGKHTKKFTDASYIENLVLMQALGGDAVDDLGFIREDKVLSKMLGGTPGKTSTHNYLSKFVNKEDEEKRGYGKSFVPEMAEHLEGFDEVTRYLLARAPQVRDISTVTLDQDATFIKTGVRGALCNYESERSFEAFNTYSPEYDIMISSEFRDGNVTPGFRQLENLQRALSILPEGVKQVRLRSDTAGYQTELLKYCAEGRSERFGVIEFAISSPVGKEIKAAARALAEKEWRRIGESKQECAEIVFVPNKLCPSKKSPEYRFIAIREELGGLDSDDAGLYQGLLFDEEELEGHPVAKLHPTEMNGKVYKVFAVVTNLTWEPEEIAEWQRERCGKSEEVHRILKDELAGGHVPTSALGANAAWWQITVLSFNILSMVKRVCLGEEYRTSRPKRLRLGLFSLVARLGSHARRCVLTVFGSLQAKLFESAWNKLCMLKVLTE